MSSTKGVKQRISNVRTTKQIMRAMDMVAATKLQKARVRLETTRPLYQEAKRIIDNIKNIEEARDNTFIQRNKVKSTAYVVITSDKGLCGSYNINISQKALAHMRDKNEKILVIGSKGSEYFKRRNKNIVRRITDLSEARMYEGSSLMGERLASMYVSGEVDEIFLAYTYFQSTLNYIPRVERMLPVSDEPINSAKAGIMKYEPDVDIFLDHAIPLYLHAYLYAATAESIACEHAARMVNMESASKNATEILEDLNRMYNRKRQAGITQELNEIVGGANILR
ncbi:MAG: ATP synthase F1 subunit gamma [Christensenellales bacterium]|jgi:F-type H+-transporting ATPase subunit gamma